MYIRRESRALWLLQSVAVCFRARLEATYISPRSLHRNVKAKMLQLLLLGLRSLLVSAQDDVEDGVVEDELPPSGDLPFPGGKMPTADEILKMLDSMSGLSDKDKEDLRQELLKNAQSGAGVGEEFAEEGASHLVTSIFTSQLFVLLAMLAIVFGILVFFGYKLYKSLSERERKREEKKKNKQMKKKK